MKPKYPDEILVYVYETLDDGMPVYSVAVYLDELPEDQNGTVIGTYALLHTKCLHVKRELK